MVLEIFELASEEVRIKLQYLDSYTEKFIYTSWKFDVSASDMDDRARKHGVVLSFYSQINWMGDWKSALEKISLWPFQYYLFPDDPNRKRLGSEFNVEKFLQKINLEDEVTKAQKYSEFRALAITEDWHTEADNKHTST